MGAFEPTGQRAAGQFQQSSPSGRGQQLTGGQPAQQPGRQPQQGPGGPAQQGKFRGSAGNQGMPAGSVNQQPEERRFKTRNSLPDDVRSSACQNLNQILADTIDLRTQVTAAHWNVKGINFYQFHELFEELAEVLTEYEDRVAERVTALGGYARGTVRQAATRSHIPELPSATTQGRAFVQQLAARLANFDTSLYHHIRAAEADDDLDTADLLNEISREVSHYLWLLEAHLQDQPQGQVWGGGQGQSPQH